MLVFRVDTSDLDSAERRFDSELAGVMRRGVVAAAEHGAARARSDHTFKNRTGRLERSIKARLVRSSNRSATAKYSATMPYAKYVEFGTRAHWIVARRKSFLVFHVGGRKIFRKRVWHPGGAPYPFMRPSVRHAREYLRFELQVEISRAGRRAFR